MSVPPKFFQKYKRIYSPSKSRESFQDFLEGLNQTDWFTLIGSVLEGSDQYTETVVAPPPDSDCLDHLFRLLEQSSPETSRLAGMALGEHVRVLSQEIGSDKQLQRLIVYIQIVRIGVPVTIVEDLVWNERHPSEFRLAAAMVLAEIWPEKLNPTTLNLKNTASYLPAIVAAARNSDVGWLDHIFSERRLPKPKHLDPLKSPLRMALKRYLRIYGVVRLEKLFALSRLNRWLLKFITVLLEESADLAQERNIFSRVNSPEHIPGILKPGFDTRMGTFKRLQQETMAAIQNLWTGLSDDQFDDEIGDPISYKLPHLIQISRSPEMLLAKLGHG